jgi:hypothetical protein
MKCFLKCDFEYYMPRYYLVYIMLVYNNHGRYILLVQLKI